MTKRFAACFLHISYNFITWQCFQAVAVEDNAANLEAVLEPEDEAVEETPEDPDNVTEEPADEAEGGEADAGNKIF